MGKLILTIGDYLTNKAGADAVVNAANEYMIKGGGICKVIYEGAGDELLTYCQKNYPKNMETGEVRITPGFDLHIDIIHVLAPKYYEEENPLEKLLKTYDNLLNEILKRKYKKVLVCSLGTGFFGYDHDKVAHDVINLLNDFCMHNDVDIIFNNYYPVYKDYYLKEYLKINNISIKDLPNLDNEEMFKFLKDNNLLENNIKQKYDMFLKDRDLKDLGLSEKILYMQYVLEKNNFRS